MNREDLVTLIWTMFKLGIISADLIVKSGRVHVTNNVDKGIFYIYFGKIGQVEVDTNMGFIVIPTTLEHPESWTVSQIIT